MHEKFGVVPINKTFNNVVIVCNKFCVQKILLEVGIYGDYSNTYQLLNKRASDVIFNNLQFSECLVLETRQEHV